jgi:hypothetical protein
MFCCIPDCHKKLEGYPSSPYTSCQSCYKVHVCDKDDEQHKVKLLFNEACRSYHAEYKVCVMCALETFQTSNYKNYKAGEEHCWCPCCNYDFGLVKDLDKEVAEELKQVQAICSIEGCVPIENHKGRFWGQNYGWCQACEEFSICYNGATGEPEHEAALLYCEPYDEKGGHEGSSFCKACATKAYKETYPDSKEERCICPLCCREF